MKSELVTQVKECRCCTGPLLDAFQLPATPPADDYITSKELARPQPFFPLDLAICQGCGLFQLKHVVNPCLLYKNFLYRTSNSLGLVDHFKTYAAAVSARAGGERGLVVDIGSNDGTLLRFFKDQGFSVLGVDPAETVAQEANDSGVPTIPKFFNAAVADEIIRQYGPASIVTTNNTFANIDDIHSFLVAIQRLLNREGLLVIETAYVVDHVEKMLFDNIYHEHLSYFSVSSLDVFFRRHGMHVVEAERVSTKGGSIRLYVKYAKAGSTTAKTAQELIELEQKRGFLELPRFKEYFCQLEVRKSKVQQLLSSLRSKGLLMAGYGASHSVTTLLFYFGVGEFFEFLVDDNPLKHGFLSPGYHLPVLPPEEIFLREIDYVAILAWQYNNAIYRRRVDWITKGKKFIELFPNPQILT